MKKTKPAVTSGPDMAIIHTKQVVTYDIKSKKSNIDVTPLSFSTEGKKPLELVQNMVESKGQLSHPTSQRPKPRPKSNSNINDFELDQESLKYENTQSSSSLSPLDKPKKAKSSSFSLSKFKFKEKEDKRSSETVPSKGSGFFAKLLRKVSSKHLNELKNIQRPSTPEFVKARESLKAINTTISYVVDDKSSTASILVSPPLSSDIQTVSTPPPIESKSILVSQSLSPEIQIASTPPTSIESKPMPGDQPLSSGIRNVAIMSSTDAREMPVDQHKSSEIQTASTPPTSLESRPVPVDQHASSEIHTGSTLSSIENRSILISPPLSAEIQGASKSPSIEFRPMPVDQAVSSELQNVAVIPSTDFRAMPVAPLISSEIQETKGENKQVTIIEQRSFTKPDDFKSVETTPGEKTSSIVASLKILNAVGLPREYPSIPLLYIVRGKKRLIPHLVDTKWSSLNQTDCFILDTFCTVPDKDRVIFVITGLYSSKIRASKVMEIANMMRDYDYSAKARIYTIELAVLSQKNLTDDEKLFVRQMISRYSEDTVEALKSFTKYAPMDENEFESLTESTYSLYEFSSQNCNGIVLVTGASKLSRELLKSENVYALYCDKEIFIWRGIKSSDTDFELAKKSFNDNLTSIKMNEGFERVVFMLKFIKWLPGKDNSPFKIMAVKQPGNIKMKDKTWMVYDRGGDMKKLTSIDVTKMLRDRNDLPILKVETMDTDPSELHRRDWGYVDCRIWSVKKLNSQARNFRIDGDGLSNCMMNLSRDRSLVLKSDDCMVFLYEYCEQPRVFDDPALVSRINRPVEEIASSMKENHVIYIWIGNLAKISEQSLIAHLVLGIEKNIKKRSGSPVKGRHVRVMEGKEPLHFLNILCGQNVSPNIPPKYVQIVRKSDHPLTSISSFAIDTDIEKSLWHVFGQSRDQVRAFQITDLKKIVVTSGHCYVFSMKSSAIVWNGFGSFEWERSAALTLAKDVLKLKNVTVITADTNDSIKDHFPDYFVGDMDISFSNEAFWKVKPRLLNGEYRVQAWKIGYQVNSNPIAQDISSPLIQQDLCEDSVYILDAYFRVFLWIGAHVGSDKEAYEQKSIGHPRTSSLELAVDISARGYSAGYKDIKLALQTAVNYLDHRVKKSPNLPSETDIVVLQSGQESPHFKTLFPRWQSKVLKGRMHWPSNISIQQAINLFETSNFTHAELAQFALDRSKVPFGVDIEHLEQHLPRSDFVKLFGIEYEKFLSFSTWKQIELKRKVGLF